MKHLKMIDWEDVINKPVLTTEIPTGKFFVLDWSWDVWSRNRSYSLKLFGEMQRCTNIFDFKLMKFSAPYPSIDEFCFVF